MDKVAPTQFILVIILFICECYWWTIFLTDQIHGKRKREEENCVFIIRSRKQRPTRIINWLSKFNWNIMVFRFGSRNEANWNKITDFFNSLRGSINNCNLFCGQLRQAFNRFYGHFTEFKIYFYSLDFFNSYVVSLIVYVW